MPQPDHWTEEELVNLIDEEMRSGPGVGASEIAACAIEVIRGIGHLLVDRDYGQSDRIMAVQRVIQKWHEVVGHPSDRA